MTVTVTGRWPLVPSHGHVLVFARTRLHKEKEQNTKTELPQWRLLLAWGLVEGCVIHMMNLVLLLLLLLLYINKRVACCCMLHAPKIKQQTGKGRCCDIPLVLVLPG